MSLKPVRDAMRDVRAAGTTIAKNEFETVKESLAVPRPSTPPHIARFRTSRCPARPEHTLRFGVVSGNSGDNACNLLHTAQTSEIGQYFLDRTESIYASRQKEPLGRAFTRGHILPAAAAHSDFKFGLETKEGEDVRTILYPTEVNTNGATRYDPLPPEIKNTYDWAACHIDPEKYRFGAPAPVVTGTTSELLVLKRPLLIGMRRREDHKAAHQHEVGRARPVTKALRGTPNVSFGLPSNYRSKSGPEWGARECITGDWCEGDKLPSADLSHGKITTPVNTIDLLAAGTPSIQTRKAAPKVRSLASTINYGDGPLAHELLYPPKFSFDGILESDFTDERPLDQLRSLFDAARLKVSDDMMPSLEQAIRNDHASAGRPTILSYQRAFNEINRLL